MARAHRTDGALNPALAVEIAECQRLVKGYSDTHERGLRNYEMLMAAVERAGARLAPATLRELRDAALADEHGNKLRAALAQHALAEEETDDDGPRSTRHPRFARRRSARPESR